jgi:restriction endonuclease Mrr
LLDCTELAKRTFAPNLAVTVSHAYEVKRIDTDYFGEG